MILTEWLNTHDLSACLPPAYATRLYPKRAEREEWEKVPEELKTLCLEKAESFLGYEWPSLSAAAFMEFRRSGDREIYEKPHFARRRALEWLVLGECIEGKGRFADDIVNGIWCICEESFWGVSAHNGANYSGVPGAMQLMLPDVEDPYIDLFASETAALLTWIQYLMGGLLDSVSWQVSRRIDIEMERRIKQPFLARCDFWWMGYHQTVNNWNPWILSNLITVFLLGERDETRRRLALEKILTCLDRFLAAYHEDGGCDEGTSYWGAAGGALFDCLEQLFLASGGKIDLFREKLIGEIGRFLYRAHIDGDYFVNFADGGARVNISSCMVYRYGRCIGDEKLMGLAAGIPSRSYRMQEGSLRRMLPCLFTQKEMAACGLTPPYERDVWFPGIQVMAARENASKEGLYLAAKGGHNAESHNHNDVGSCVLYLDGKPVLIDAGVGVYTRQTFSDERYQIWTMQSQYHNLPTINGQMQCPGAEFRAEDVRYSASDREADFSLELRAAYPAEAGISSYRRSYRLVRGAGAQAPAYVEIADYWTFAGEQNTLTLNLLTAKEPQVFPDSILLDSGEGRLRLSWEGAALSALSEWIPVADAKLSPVWGDGVWRLVLTVENPAREGQIRLRFEKE